MRSTFWPHQSQAKRCGASIGFVKVVQSCKHGRQFVNGFCADPIARENAQEGVELAPTTLTRISDLDEDIACICDLCLAVDNDREPAPENAPTAHTTWEVNTVTGLYQGQPWGWDGVCERTLKTPTKVKAGFHNNWKPHGKSHFEHFKAQFNTKWFEEVCVPGTNKNLKNDNLPGTNLADMYTYTGLKLIMATLVGFTQRQFFSDKEFHERTNPCPLKLNRYIPAQRMELLDNHLCLNDKAPPTYKDCFGEARQMMDMLLDFDQ